MKKSSTFENITWFVRDLIKYKIKHEREHFNSDKLMLGLESAGLQFSR